MKINLQKKLNGLVPFPESLDDYNKLKFDTLYSCEIKATRKPWRHRQFFSLLKISRENCQIGDYSADQFREMVIKGAGYTETYLDYENKTIINAQSIKYSSMDDLAFDGLYEAAVGFILKYILIGSTREEVDVAVEVAMRY